MGIAVIIQMILTFLPLLLSFLKKNQKADLDPVRAKRIERILGLCGHCRAAAAPAGFMPDDQVGDDGTDPLDPHNP